MHGLGVGFGSSYRSLNRLSQGSCMFGSGFEATVREGQGLAREEMAVKFLGSALRCACGLRVHGLSIAALMVHVWATGEKPSSLDAPKCQN
jgi:hypothetical protein